MKRPSILYLVAVLSVGSTAIALTMLPTLAGAADQTFGTATAPCHDVDTCGHAGPRAAPRGRLQRVAQEPHQLTVVPTDTYVAKIGTAAGSNGLPDLVSGDVVFMPNWTSGGDCSRTSPTRSPRCRSRMRSRPAPSRRQRGRASSTACRSSPTCRSGCTTRSCSSRRAWIPTKAPRRWPSSRLMLRPWPNWATTSMARSSAVTAAAATCSRGGPSPGPTASRS